MRRGRGQIDDVVVDYQTDAGAAMGGKCHELQLLTPPILSTRCWTGEVDGTSGPAQSAAVCRVMLAARKPLTRFLWSSDMTSVDWAIRSISRAVRRSTLLAA